MDPVPALREAAASWARQTVNNHRKTGVGFVKGRGPGSYGDIKGDLMSKLGVPGSGNVQRGLT